MSDVTFSFKVLSNVLLFRLVLKRNVAQAMMLTLELMFLCKTNIYLSIMNYCSVLDEMINVLKLTNIIKNSKVFFLNIVCKSPLLLHRPSFRKEYQ